MLRLGCTIACIACIAGVAACAQGIQSEGFTDGDGSAGALAAAGSVIATSGALNGGAGSSARGGATVGAGRANGGSSNGGSSNGGSSNGGKSGATGSAGKGGAAGSGTGGGSAGAGTGPQGCSHPQPGEDLGLTVQSKSNAPDLSVPYVFFEVQIDSPEADSMPLSELTLRYYFVNDLTSPMIDIYSPQVIHTSSNTDNVSAGDVKTKFAPTYLEVSFSSTYALLKGEHLKFQAHFSSLPVANHDQSNDYSFNSASAFTPNCKLALFRGASNALAWGTPQP